tara:strand:+ start:109 stop:381 length:273 start_codon:yes stop_codon:yes gene_type:complete
MNGKYIRIRRKIFSLLEDKEMNTRQINDWVNKNTHQGITPNALGNVLKKSPEFKRVGFERIGSTSGGTYQICVWSQNVVDGDEEVEQNES